jgi:hypothetical protein
MMSREEGSTSFPMGYIVQSFVLMAATLSPGRCGWLTAKARALRGPVIAEFVSACSFYNIREAR